MKKLNIACIFCIIWGLIGIVLNTICIYNNWSFTYNLILFFVNSILIGIIIGIMILSNMIVKARCNFDREEEK